MICTKKVRENTKGGFRYEVHCGGKVVASGTRSTRELAHTAADREAAVHQKVAGGGGARSRGRRHGGGGSNMVPEVPYYLVENARWGRPGGGGGGARAGYREGDRVCWRTHQKGDSCGTIALVDLPRGLYVVNWDAPSSRGPFSTDGVRAHEIRRATATESKASKAKGGGGANLVGNTGYFAAMGKTADQRLAHLLHGGGGARAGSTTKDPIVGRRVEIAPHYDLWMMGARFGEVNSVSKDGKIAYVRMDNTRVKKLAKILREDLKFI